MDQWFKCMYKMEALKLLGKKLERIIYNHGMWKNFLIKIRPLKSLKDWKKMTMNFLTPDKTTTRKVKRKKTNWENQFATVSQRALLTSLRVPINQYRPATH